MSRALPLGTAPTAWFRVVTRRVRERDFWLIQGGLVAVTLFHVGYEALTEQDDRAFLHALHHIPATLYVVPVAYAGTLYGIEGGLLTGLTSLVLTLPNMMLWHRAGYAWFAELLFVAGVATVAVGLGVPAARERRQRREIERRAWELSLVNAVARAISTSRDIEATVTRALGIAVETLDLEAAAIGLRRWDKPETVIVASVPEARPAAVRIERAMREEVEGIAGLGDFGDGAVRVPLAAMGLSGILAVQPVVGSSLTVEDIELLSAIGNQIALAVDSLVVHRDEQDHLRSYVQMATQAQEDERLRIAREIHDETAQLLALIRRGLRDLSKRAAPDLLEGPLGLAELTDLSEATLGSLRKFASDLRPGTLDDLGLVPALRWLATNLERRAGVDASVVVDGDPKRLRPDVEVALFRIIQEAFRNIERHAGAGSVSLEIAYAADSVRVEIRDDGRGFSVPARLTELPMNGRLGLVGMAERARLVGGSIALDSARGRGTLVAVEVPTSEA